MEYSYVDLPEALTEVLPHTVHNPVVETEAQQFVPEDRRECRGIVYESYIGGTMTVVEVILDNREEGVDGIMSIPAWPHPQLVVSHGAIRFRVFGEASDKDTLKDF